MLLLRNGAQPGGHDAPAVKGPDDKNIGLYCPRRIENGSQHDRPMIREGIRMGK